MKETNVIRDAMMDFFLGNPKQIQHFIKVEAFATLIAEKEKVDKDTAIVISILGYIHDIGIKFALEKYNSSIGIYQEELGKEPAKALVLKYGFSKDIANRVSYVVAHHHTYSNIDNIEYQILVEADFIVNIFEENVEKSNIKIINSKIFKTKTGTEILTKMFNLIE